MRGLRPAVVVLGLLLAEAAPAELRGIDVFIEHGETVIVGDVPAIVLGTDIQVAEMILVSDQAQMAVAVEIDVVETIHVSDVPGLVPALGIMVEEPVMVVDNVSPAPGLAISVGESISVTDAPVLGGPVLIFVEEPITIGDGVSVSAALPIVVEETITVVDAAEVADALPIVVAELVSVMDSVEAVVLIPNVIFSDGFEFVPAPPLPPMLNDTGITRGAFWPTGLSSVCEGETIEAQDCVDGRDAIFNDDSDGHAGFVFTKLDTDGSPLPAGAPEWSCVKDEITQLTWEIKTDDNGLRDGDYTYSWYNPDFSVNGGNVGMLNGGTCLGLESCDTFNFVDAVNTIGLCGANDWRMPTREELMGIINYNEENPSIDETYFPDERFQIVWTGSANATDQLKAWFVFFINGTTDPTLKSSPGRIRLVRDPD